MNEQRLTVEEFVTRAIKRLRIPPRRGIHAVYSGFNTAFREYFPELDPRMETAKLEKEGKIVIRFARGGVLLFLPEDAQGMSARALVEKITGD